MKEITLLILTIVCVVGQLNCVILAIIFGILNPFIITMFSCSIVYLLIAIVIYSRRGK